MNDKYFVEICKKIISSYKKISEDDICVVWQCKILKNYKALFFLQNRIGHYIEITYNGEKDEIYYDEYIKHRNAYIENINKYFEETN